MNLTMFDQSILLDAQKRLTPEAEAIRLSNEFRNKLPSFKIDSIFGRIDVKAKTNGFDVETCEFNILKNWILSDIKKSPSQIAFILRIIQLRFPNETAQFRRSVDLPTWLKSELDMIEGYMTNDISKLGYCGFHNQVFLDKKWV